MTWLKVRNWRDIVEALFVLLALVGLAMLVGVAWTLVAAGVLGAVACERSSTVSTRRAQDEQPRLERVA